MSRGFAHGGDEMMTRVAQRVRLGTVPKRRAQQKKRTLWLRKARSHKQMISIWRDLYLNMRQGEGR